MTSAAPAPLKPRHYHILLALAAGARHGQAVARDVEQLSDGAVRLWPATLYATLDELLERGWIEELSENPADQSERKRFFTLTRAGRQALAGETDRLAEVVRVARTRMRRSGAVS